MQSSQKVDKKVLEEFPEIEYKPSCDMVDGEEHTCVYSYVLTSTVSLSPDLTFTTEWKKPRYFDTLASSLFPVWGCAGGCGGSQVQEDAQDFKRETIKPSLRPDRTENEHMAGKK